MITVLLVVAGIVLLAFALSIRIVKQYEQGCCSASAASSAYACQGYG